MIIRRKLIPKAFTLVELLVVIAIVGLIAAISIIALNNARAKTRDVKRVGDVKQISTALEMFFNSAGRYPDDLEWASGSLEYNGQTYLAVIPSAPSPADGSCDGTTNAFSYTQDNNGESYTLNFCTGGPVAALPAGNLCATPGGISSNCSSACVPDCSGKTCGDDGCGGVCGICTGSEACSNYNCFVPSDLSNLSLWYDASGLVDNSNNSYGEVSGGLVDSWKNLAGVDHAVSGGTNGYGGKPSLSSSVSYFNDKPGIIFDGSNLTLNDMPGSSAISSPATIFAVYNQQPVSGNSTVMNILGTAFYLYYKHSTEEITMSDNGSSWLAAPALNRPFTAIVTAVVDPLGSELYLNGSLKDSGNINNYSSTYLFIGHSSWGEYLNGAIAEIIVYNSVLSNSDRQIVEDYLNDKYNIY